MNYYQRLKDIREDRDITQLEAAAHLGIFQTQLSCYELGKKMMGIDKYIALAKYYNVSLDYLCGILETPEPLFRGSKPPKTTPRPNEEEKLLQAYKKAPSKIKNAIKTLLEI